MIMSDFIKKAPWGLVTFVLQLALVIGLYLHTVSVKAAVQEQLKEYALKSFVVEQMKSHGEWSAEAVKRMDGKMDDMLERIKRMEEHQMRNKP